MVLKMVIDDHFNSIISTQNAKNLWKNFMKLFYVFRFFYYKDREKKM